MINEPTPIAAVLSTISVFKEMWTPLTSLFVVVLLIMGFKNTPSASIYKHTTA